MRKSLPVGEWTKFKKGLCNGCWARCCHGWPVQASIPDMIRLGHLTKEEASLELSKASTRLKKDKIIRSFNPKSFIFVLGQQKNGDCIFLNEERTCTVYENRPEICRQFPKMGLKPGFCPHEPK